MKKITVILLIIAMLCSIIPAFAQESGDVVSGCHGLQARVPLGGSEKKLDTAKAAILYELNSDTLVYSWNPDQVIDPTGMVKFLTALIALEEGNLQEEITVTRDVLNTVMAGAVSAGLKAGEVLTLQDLLYCVMVSSANDAAAVIAHHIGGSQEAFAAKMNEKAQALGCTNSHFVNPHGLPQENQYSTARDLAIIVEAALENQQFTTMFSAKEYTVPATSHSEPRQLNTTNHMMSTATIKNHLDERVTGGKPASASKTDRSMICTAEVGGSRFLCVVMSCEAVISEDGYSVITYGSFEETKKLLDFGFYNFSVRQVIDQRQVFAQYSVIGGENDVVLHPDGDVYTVLPKDFDANNLIFSDRVEAERLQAPVKKGDVLGSVQISYGSIVLGSCDLVAQYDVAEAGTVIRPAEPPAPDEEEAPMDLSFLKWIGLGILAAVVLAILVLLGIRLARGARIRRMHRRRMRERRRSR